MSLYLMMTNSPQQRANWQPADRTPVYARGNTVKDQWWWASRSIEDLEAVARELQTKNPHPVPPMHLTVKQVEEIPPGYQ